MWRERKYVKEKGYFGRKLENVCAFIFVYVLERERERESEREREKEKDC